MSTDLAFKLSLVGKLLSHNRNSLSDISAKESCSNSVPIRGSEVAKHMTEHTLINNKHDDEIDPLIRITKLLLDAKNLAKENNHFTITTLIDLAIYQLKEEYRMNLEKNSKS